MIVPVHGHSTALAAPGQAVLEEGANPLRRCGGHTLAEIRGTCAALVSMERADTQALSFEVCVVRDDPVKEMS